MAKDTPTSRAVAHGSPLWAQALELFLSQMIEVLEGEGRAGFSAAALARWSELCCQRMQETESAAPEVISQLRSMTSRVVT
jgi:predicted methyltransferase